MTTTNTAQSAVLPEKVLDVYAPQTPRPLEQQPERRGAERSTGQHLAATFHPSVQQISPTSNAQEFPTAPAVLVEFKRRRKKGNVRPCWAISNPHTRCLQTALLRSNH